MKPRGIQALCAMVEKSNSSTSSAEGDKNHVEQHADNNNDGTLFSGDGLDRVALAAQGAKLERVSASMEIQDASIQGEDLFSGDITALDPAALAAQAAQLEALMESMDANLETNEIDLNQETEIWSAAAKISTTEDETNTSSGTKLERITKKINQIAVKTLQEEEAELLNEIQQQQQQQQQSEQENQPHNNLQKEDNNNYINNRITRQSIRVTEHKSQEEEEPEPEPEESEEEVLDEVAVNDDMSIDDSASDSLESDASSLTTLKSEDDDNDDDDDDDDNDDDNDSNDEEEALHSSSKSLSLEEIEMEMDQDEEQKRYVADEVLVQNGVLRKPDPQQEGAYVCDWDKWLEWKTQQQQMERSSQRWDNSFQDSSLRMPERRNSDDSSDVSAATTPTTTSFADNSNDSSSNSNNSGEISFFDWKAWRRRKQGQRSSSSQTNSFSMSNDDDDQDKDEDGFDSMSVLKKLDEWEVMEESSRQEQDDDHSNRSNGSSNSSGSKSSSCKKSEDGSTTSSSHHHQHDESGKKRAQSEHHKSRRATVPMHKRGHSDHSIALEDEDDPSDNNNGQQQWKDWQREKRKSRMQASISNHQHQRTDSHHSEGEDSFGNASASDGSSWGEASFETDWGESFGTSGEDDEDEDDYDEATAPLRSQSERLPPPNNPRPRVKLRSQSLIVKPPSRRSLHMSPMRSPMKKSPRGGGGDQWKSWHKEKRRTGMLKKTLSARDLPFNDDSGDASKAESQSKDGHINGNRKKFIKSQSEKWGNSNNNSKEDSGSNGDRRQQFQRAKSLQLAKVSDADTMVFDWKAYRKDQQSSDLERLSRSEHGPIILPTTSTNDGEKAPQINDTHALRRAQSEGNIKHNNLQNQAEVFDWRLFRKDRRRTIKKSNSETLKIEVAS